MALGKRREFEVFTLSFLDCICCGFGAIILLLVLTDVGKPIVIEKSEKNLNGQIDALQRQLFELRGETDVLNRELQGRMTVLSTEQARLASLSGDLSKIRGEFKASKGEASVTNIVETELVESLPDAHRRDAAPAQEPAAQDRHRAGGRRHPGRQRVDHLHASTRRAACRPTTGKTPRT